MEPTTINLQTITFIYGLYDPITTQLRYVGKTICPTHRIDGHANSPHANIREWIAGLRDKGMCPSMKILEYCDGDGVELEKTWIQKCIADGHPLLNSVWTKPRQTNDVGAKRKRKASKDGECVRVNLTQPPEWWDAFEDAASAADLSLSGWLGECGLAALPESVRESLPPRPLASRPRKNT